MLRLESNLVVGLVNVAAITTGEAVVYLNGQKIGHGYCRKSKRFLGAHRVLESGLADSRYSSPNVVSIAVPVESLMILVLRSIRRRTIKKQRIAGLRG